MARCPDCNKFVSLEENDPEIDLLLNPGDNPKDLVIEGTVRLVNACAECGTELKEAILDIEQQIPMPDGHIGHGVTFEILNSERVNRAEGKGRGLKTFYGFEAAYRIECSCGALEPIEDNIEAEIQASDMEDL